jgi:RND family efflux transporter MFP subunit
MTSKEKRTGIIQLIAIIIFIILSFMASASLKIEEKLDAESSAGELPLNVTVEAITPSNHAIQFQATGIVSSRTNINIVPQVSGKVISVNDNFYEGGQFKSGDVLFQIDPIDFELTVRQLEAELSKSQTSLNLAQAESAAAKKEWRQMRGKRPIPDLVAKIPQLNDAQAALSAAQAQLQNARLDLERTVVSMPFDGVVLSGDLSVGQFISAGQNYGSVYDGENIEVKSSLNEQQLYWLQDSDTQNIKLSHASLHGTISTTGFLKRSASVLNPNTRFASVAFGIHDTSKLFMPGQFVTIDINGPTYTDITVIPLTAYQKNGQIYTVDDNDKLGSFTPDILYSTNDIVMVKNLKNLTQIVTSKLSGAINGTSVKITDTKDDNE